MTLDPDVEALVKRAMKDRGIGLKAAINDGLRAGLGASRASRADLSFPSFDMGVPFVDLTHANRVAENLEDEASRQKLAEGR